MNCIRCSSELRFLGYDELTNDNTFACPKCFALWTEKYLSSKEVLDMVKVKVPESNFLRASDLSDGQILTIKRIEYVPAEESQFRKEQYRAIVEFNGKEKILNLNISTRRKFIAVWGDESENWHGKKFKVLLDRRNVMGNIQNVVIGIPENY